MAELRSGRAIVCVCLAHVVCVVRWHGVRAESRYRGCAPGRIRDPTWIPEICARLCTDVGIVCSSHGGLCVPEVVTAGLTDMCWSLCLGAATPGPVHSRARAVYNAVRTVLSYVYYVHERTVTVHHELICISLYLQLYFDFGLTSPNLTAGVPLERKFYVHSHCAVCS